MGESKHTPGPWQAGLDMPLVANNNPDPRVVWSDSLQVADCRTPWVTMEQSGANAKLVAAAPELLEVLSELVRLKDMRPGDYESRKPLAWEAAREAIAKATN